MGEPPFPLTPGIGRKGLAAFFLPFAPPSSPLICMRCFRLGVFRTGQDSEMVVAEMVSQYIAKI